MAPCAAQSHLCSQGSSAVSCCHVSLCFGWFPSASVSAVPALCRPGTSRALRPVSWGEGPLVTLLRDLFGHTVVWPISRDDRCAAACVGGSSPALAQPYLVLVLSDAWVRALDVVPIYRTRSAFSVAPLAELSDMSKRPWLCELLLLSLFMDSICLFAGPRGS